MPTYIIRRGEPHVLDALIQHLDRATEAVPQEVRVKDYKSRPKAEQYRYLFGMVYTQARDWIYEHEGVALNPLVMHHHMKTLFQPIVDSYPAEVIIDGRVQVVDVPVPMSTTKNSVSKMVEFTEKVAHFYATEHGVKFRETRFSS